MNQISRNAALWVFLLIMIPLLYNVFEKPQQKASEIPYSQFRAAVEEGKIEEVLIKQSEITGKFREGFGQGGQTGFLTYPPPANATDTELIKDLRAAKVKFDGRPAEEESWFLLLLANWFPMLLLIGIWFFFMRQIQVGGGKALSFGKSRARLLEEGPSKVTFDDVAGIDESKEELEAIVQFLKDPKKIHLRWLQSRPSPRAVDSASARARHARPPVLHLGAGLRHQSRR